MSTKIDYAPPDLIRRAQTGDLDARRELRQRGRVHRGRSQGVVE